MSEIDLLNKFSIENQTPVLTSTARIHPKFLHSNPDDFNIAKNVQQKRRQEFLSNVQRKRELIIEKMRNLIENDSETMAYDDDDNDDTEIHLESSSTSIDEDMSCDIDQSDKMIVEPTIKKERKNVKKRSNRNRSHRKSISSLFMLSEWLVDIPDDFFTDWYFVCCPKGRRTLLIANGDRTRAYNRHGYFLFEFESRLPGGGNVASKHRSSHSQSSATKSILDCIWIESERRFYILDVFIWNGCSFYGCDTEFRFYWIHNHIQDEQSPASSSMISIKTLPYMQCTKDNLQRYTQNGGASYPFNCEIDGILFYHKQAPYTAGTTPLVCWLKVSMLNEVIFTK